MGERIRVGLGGLVVGVLALLALGTTAVHADQGVTQLASVRNATLARESNAYYSCLGAEAHSLFSSHDVVYQAEPTLGSWTTVTKVIGGWAHLTLQRDKATAAVLLQHSSAPVAGSCDGDFLVSIRLGPGGRVVIVRGTQGAR